MILQSNRIESFLKQLTDQSDRANVIDTKISRVNSHDCYSCFELDLKLNCVNNEKEDNDNPKFRIQKMLTPSMIPLFFFNFAARRMRNQQAKWSKLD